MKNLRSWLVVSKSFVLKHFITFFNNIALHPSSIQHSVRVIHTQDWEPVTITLQALSLVEKVEPVQVRFTLRLRDQRSMWMQDGCKVYMASNGSCFMVTWTIFKNHLLEVGPTQNRQTMAFRILTTIDFSIFLSRTRTYMNINSYI